MADDFRDFCRSPRVDLTVNALKEIQPSTPELPPPSLIANAVSPEWLTCERRERLYRVPDETASCMGIQSKQERNKQMVGVPKCFVGLLSYLRMSCGEHEQHAEEHYVACDPAGLSIMNLYCCSRSDLISLDIEEATNISGAQLTGPDHLLHIMRTDVDNSPDQQRVCYLPMKKLIFI